MTLRKPITNLFFMLIVVGCSIAVTQLTLEKTSDVDDFGDPISRLELTIASMGEGNIPSDFIWYEAEPDLHTENLELKDTRLTSPVKMDLRTEGCKNFILLNFRAANEEENKLIFIGVAPLVNEAAEEVVGKNGRVIHLKLDDKSGNPLFSHVNPATYNNLVVIKQEGGCFFDFLESEITDYTKNLDHLKPFYTLLKPATLLFKRPLRVYYDDIPKYQESLETMINQFKSYPKDDFNLINIFSDKRRNKLFENSEKYIINNLQSCDIKKRENNNCSLFGCLFKKKKKETSECNLTDNTKEVNIKAIEEFKKDLNDKLLSDEKYVQKILYILEERQQVYPKELIDHIYKLLSLDNKNLYFELRKNDLIHALKVVFQKDTVQEYINLRGAIIEKDIEQYENTVVMYKNIKEKKDSGYVLYPCDDNVYSKDCIQKLLEKKYKIAKSLIVLDDSNSEDIYLYPAFLFKPYGISKQHLQIIDGIYIEDIMNYESISDNMGTMHQVFQMLCKLRKKHDMDYGNKNYRKRNKIDKKFRNVYNSFLRDIKESHLTDQVKKMHPNKSHENDEANRKRKDMVKKLFSNLNNLYKKYVINYRVLYDQEKRNSHKLLQTLFDIIKSNVVSDIVAKNKDCEKQHETNCAGNVSYNERPKSVDELFKTFSIGWYDLNNNPPYIEKAQNNEVSREDSFNLNNNRSIHREVIKKIQRKIII